MTVLKTAYDTTACRDYLMKKTTDAIEVAGLNGQLPAMAGTIGGIQEVQGGSATVDAIPAFAHPIAVTEGQTQKIAVDVRQYGKWDQHQAVFHVRNATDYRLAQHRSKLNHIWLNHSPTILRDISPLPMAVFATWISEAITRYKSLNPQEQLNLTVLAAIWYSSQFTDEETFSDREKMGLANQLQKTLRISPEVTIEMLDAVPVVQSAHHFCELARQVTDSVRLQDFTTGLLFANVGSAFARNDWRELVAVALEHPPTWMALVMLAVTERTYKHTVVTKITERTSFRADAQNFVRAVTKMSETLTTA